MPLVNASAYRVPWYLPGPHLQTIVPNVTRRRIQARYKRERFELPDTDFVDVDWLRTDPNGSSNPPCGIVLHGLEGSSRAPYMKSMARALSRSGFHVGSLNLRGCSGEPNRLRRFYHSGDTEGLAVVLDAVGRRYNRVALVGFSLGGNVLLKYLGECPERVPQSVKAAAAFSVPCDLASSAECLAEKRNAFYMKRFIRMLGAKLKAKERVYPQFRYESGYARMKSFREFDGFYTAPLNGFRDADDYWKQSSCRQYLSEIDRPALLVNAKNDPFLSKVCYPTEVARSSPFLHLEIPDEGGHCGFPGNSDATGYWHERRAISFFDEWLGADG